MEYDTWRDPVGPLSASAQVIVGAIANFVTGLGEVPYDMATDLITAGRAINHPNETRDPVAAACAWRKRQRMSQQSSQQSEEESEEYHDSNEFQSGRSHSDSTSLDGEDDLDSAATTLERTRSAQLEKTQTMSCAGSKRGTAFTEMHSHGKRMSMKLLKTAIWLPTDLTLSLSKGFHNAPRLYHDRMVKSTPKIIGFRSGVKAAGTV
jgi:hypothetical protein